jgi:hypothetical protein
MVDTMSPPKKLPAYGKALADRLKFSPPFMVIVAVGADAWASAKKWNLRPAVCALVLTAGQEPKSLLWPVNGLLVVIEWGAGVADALIAELVGCLLKAGALTATVRPMWVNFDEPTGHYIKTDTSLAWVQEAPTVRTFRARVAA